ncbi:MAG: IS200/IS605 family transposase [bacterium]
MSGKYLSILVHFRWSTAGREPWIEPGMRNDLYSYIGGIMNNKNAKLISAGGISDHIHLYASMPSTISIADFVNVVKSNSSRWVHESFAPLRNFAWQEGYGAFSESKSEEGRVVRYISNQETHHRKRTFKAELIGLLDKHGITYDKRYIWD